MFCSVPTAITVSNVTARNPTVTVTATAIVV